MVALTFDPRFGGNPANGDATADLGKDCVISLGGGPEIYTIAQIIASYVSPFANTQDFDRGAGTSGPGPDAFRSLTGRLVVTRGPRINESFSNGAAPNPVLYSGLPNTAGAVIFDQFIHSWDKPIIIPFPTQEGLGVLRNQSGEWLNVILVAPNMYTDPGGILSANLLFSHLHVSAFKNAPADQVVRLGDFYAE